jgi:hypothetical protein
MTTKYSTSDTTHLADDVALTDHAIHRFRERTPHDCPVGIREAYRRGEDIRDPQVARSPEDMRELARVRVYRHGHGGATADWGVVFLIVKDARDAGERPPQHACDHLVVTVVSIDGITHSPSRAYLNSHGPHGGGGGE